MNMNRFRKQQLLLNYQELLPRNNFPETLLSFPELTSALPGLMLNSVWICSISILRFSWTTLSPQNWEGVILKEVSPLEWLRGVEVGNIWKVKKQTWEKRSRDIKPNAERTMPCCEAWTPYTNYSSKRLGTKRPLCLKSWKREFGSRCRQIPGPLTFSRAL